MVGYAGGGAEAVVIEVGEEDALAYVLQSVGEDDEVEQFVVVFEGDDF